MSETEKEAEIWITHPEFDFVEVSTCGRVRTVDRAVSNGSGTYIVKGHILKQQTNKGYMRVGISTYGKQVFKYVHRLVAECFIPNPDNLPQINHKDNNPLNNNMSNLEWCTPEYNIAYKEKYGTSAVTALGCPVYAINLKTLEVLRFESQSKASRELNINDGNINSVIKGRYKQAGGYWFTNADDNAEEATRNKFGDVVADDVSKLIGV